MVFMIIIPMKNGYFIGNIPNIFRQSHINTQQKINHLGSPSISFCCWTPRVPGTMAPPRASPAAGQRVPSSWAAASWRCLPALRDPNPARSPMGSSWEMIGTWGETAIIHIYSPPFHWDMMIYYDILGISEYQLIVFFDYENHNWIFLVSEVGWEAVNTLKGHGTLRVLANASQ